VALRLKLKSYQVAASWQGFEKSFDMWQSVASLQSTRQWLVPSFLFSFNLSLSPPAVYAVKVNWKRPYKPVAQAYGHKNGGMGAERRDPLSA